MSETVSQQQIADLAEDASLLREEALALQNLIDTVPYDQSTPNESSILDKLKRLDQLQVTYFLPVFDPEAEEGSTKCPLESLDVAQEHLDAAGNAPREESASEESATDESPSRISPSEESGRSREVQAVLKSLSEHRTTLIDHIRELPAAAWERPVIRSGEELTLYQFALEMVQHDQQVLKEVASLVMVFQQDSWSRREINQQAAARNQMNSNSGQA